MGTGRLKNYRPIKIRDSVCLLVHILVNMAMAQEDTSTFEGLLDPDGYDDSNTTNHANDTYAEQDYLEYITPKLWTWILILCHTIVFIVGAVGNCLVCVAVYRNSSMRTVTNYFIVNLAVADFLVIVFCLPPSVVWDVTSTWWFGSAMCKIVLYLQGVSVTVSVLTLTSISIDRWYAICYPLKFKSTTGHAKTAIIVIWIIALMSEIPEAVYLTEVPSLENTTIDYFKQCVPTWSNISDTMFILCKMFFFYFSPLLLMSIAYKNIIRVLQKSGEATHRNVDSGVGCSRSLHGPLNLLNPTIESQIQTRKKAAKMLVVVVTMFAICYFPVHLMSLLRVTITLSNSELNRSLTLISHWMCYANSAINPMIYNFMSVKFRKEFRRAFESCCYRKRRSTMAPFEHFNRTEREDSYTMRSQFRTDNDFEELELPNFKETSFTSEVLCRRGTTVGKNKFDELPYE